MQTNYVIDKLGQKQSNGTFIYTPIGPQLKYVGAQQNSNIHNLEEQLILGTDKESTITTTLVEPGAGDPDPFDPYIEITEETLYKVNDSSDDYYILNKTVQTELQTSFDENENKLILNLNPKVLNHSETLSFYSNSTKSEFVKKDETYVYDDINNSVTVTDEISDIV